jgi:hypothetical protein
MTAKHLPTNPCKECEYDTYCPVFHALRLKICEKFRIYQSNLAALEKYTESLISYTKTNPLKVTEFYSELAVTVQVLESMLSKIREGK